MTRSQRVVNTLMEADPDFLALCEVLYGSDVDPAAVYDDVFGKREVYIEPAKERISKFLSEEAQRKIALATNTGGVVAAPGALYMARRAWKNNEGGIPRASANAYAKKRPNSRSGKAAGRMVRSLSNPATRKAGIAATAAGVTGMALQSANSTGDAIAARMMSKKPKEKVQKAVPLNDLVGGIINSTKGMLKPTGKHVAPTPPGGNPETNAKIGRAAANVRDKPLKTMAGTPKRAAASATAGTYAATRPGKKKARLQGQQEGYQAGLLQKNEPSLEVAGVFSKFDDDKRQAFGFASVVKKDGMPVIDRQGDYIDADEMEKAAYLYVQKSRVGGDMHRRNRDEYGIDKAHHVSDLIESMVFTPEKCKSMGLSEEATRQLEGHWWVGYQIHDDATWQEVRKNGRTGFSIHGRGKRTETSVDELMKGL